MSNSKLLKIKKILCSTILSLGILLSAMIGINFTRPDKVYASSNGGNIIKDVSKNLLGTDFDFSTSSTSTPASPSNWSESETKGVNADEKDNLIKGIVDVRPDKFSSDYHTKRPTNISFDELGAKEDSMYKNLMINAYSTPASYGYKSKNFTLESNSFYSISVTLYTHSIDGLEPNASVYITGLLNEKDEDEKDYFQNKTNQFTSINTLKTFDTYTFYISTSESKNINIELWLGEKTIPNKGAVFFNKVNVTRYSEDAYNIKTKDFDENIINNSENFKTRIINLKENFNKPFENADFENPVDNNAWTVIATRPNTHKDFVAGLTKDINFDGKTIPAPDSNCSINNSQALFMYNGEKTYQAVESKEFKINRQSYYKISFFAKSDCETGNGATVKLVDKSKSPIDAVSIKTETKINKDNNNFRNNWIQYNFYVYGSAIEDKNLTIQIWLGTKEKDSETDGYVFIDDFRIQNIDYKTFSSNSSGSYNAIMNFNEENSTFGIKNGNFDVTKNNDNTNKQPYNPSSWSYKSKFNYNTYSGIINTNKNIENIPYIPNIPGKDGENNILIIGSENESNIQSYKSEDLTISENSYYRISFYITSEFYTDNGNARIRFSNSSITLFDYVKNNSNDGKWIKEEIYLKTGFQSGSASIELILENAYGYVCFDDIKFETINEQTFQNPPTNSTNSTLPKKLDLSLENFNNNYIGKDVNPDETVIPNNWNSSENATSTKSGIIKVPGNITNINNTLSHNDTVLYILNNEDDFFSFTSKQKYTFTAQNYYKISVNILTRNLTQTKPNSKIKYGASFGLATSKEIFFSGINTLDSSNNNNWQTYTLYICPESDINSEIRLSLGNTDELTSGEVLFDNFKIEKIEKTAYESDIKNSTNDNLIKSFINYKEPPKDEDKKDEEWNNDFNWLIIPSLITGIAIIVAVIGFYARRINFKRKPKIKTKYDRRKTLDVDISKREKINLRNQIISELKDELIVVDKEMEEFKKLAEEQLQTLREKIISEQEEIKQKKLEIEAQKKVATSDREKLLKDDPTLNTNTKSEKEYVSLISKLDKQELKLQKQLTTKNIQLANANEIDKSKLSKYLDRKEFINNEIAKIEAEILEISKEDEDMWEEYKQAKEENKAKKLEEKKLKEKDKKSKKVEKVNNIDKENNKIINKDKDDNKQKTKKEVNKKTTTKNVTDKKATSKKATNKKNSDKK